MQTGDPRLQRRVGMAVLLTLACVVALAQIVMSRRRDDSGIDRGVRELAQAATAPIDLRSAALEKAERHFSASVGTVVVEPLAIIGLGVTEQMPLVLGTPDPEPPGTATLDDQQAAAYAQALLARGKPEAALAFLARPDVRAHAGRSLAVIARFAERWVAIGRPPSR